MRLNCAEFPPLSSASPRLTLFLSFYISAHNSAAATTVRVECVKKFCDVVIVCWFIFLSLVVVFFFRFLMGWNENRKKNLRLRQGGRSVRSGGMRCWDEATLDVVYYLFWVIWFSARGELSGFTSIFRIIKCVFRVLQCSFLSLFVTIIDGRKEEKNFRWNFSKKRKEQRYLRVRVVLKIDAALSPHRK